jgi:hypothetical protein
MNLKELKELVDWKIENLGHWENAQDIRVGIVVKVVGSIGGTPMVDIKSIQSGFDWDNGKFMIFPEKDLRTIEADELLALRKANEKEGWATYENANLKRENKKLKQDNLELQQLLKNK